MLLSFKSIDNHIQRQLLKLMKYAIDERESKRAIYLGYGVIRNHLMDIIEKIRDYYRYHDKIDKIYSINDMFIPGIKPKFIIPSLSDDVYYGLGNEIRSYLNGFDTLLSIDTSNYQVLNDIYYFKRYFSKMCYNSIYYALKELGTSNFTGLNLLIDTLKNKSFFDNEIVNIYEIPTIFDFDRKCKYKFGWDDYVNRYSIAHKEYKKLKRLNKWTKLAKLNSEFYDTEEALNDTSYDDIHNGDQMFNKYVKDMLIEDINDRKKFKDSIKDLIQNIDDVEEDIETDNESVKSDDENIKSDNESDNEDDNEDDNESDNEDDNESDNEDDNESDNEDDNESDNEDVKSDDENIKKKSLKTKSSNKSKTESSKPKKTIKKK